jgi:hypothetical protein
LNFTGNTLKDQTELEGHFLRLFYLTILLTVLAGARVVQSQIILSPENTALGGGGTAYITGYEALFLNPANLFIRDKQNRFEITIGAFGAATQPVLREFGTGAQIDNFGDLFSPFEPGVTDQDIGLDKRQDILDRNFPGERLQSQHLFRFETYWFGLKWNRPGRSYALSLRTRAGGRYVTGRGYYTDEPILKGDLKIIDRSLVSEFQTIHELSFGFAESFTFLNGLSPRLNEVIIGIAPKLVVGGAFQSVKYSNEFTRESDGPWNRRFSYEQLTSSDFSDATTSFLLTGYPQTAIDRHLDFADFFSPAGFGAGLDFGLTFLMPLGKDISTLQRMESETKKSLRISFSITDVGFISYSDNAQEQIIEEETETLQETGELSGTVFRGIPGQFLSFLNEDGNHPLFESDIITNNFSTILPTAMNAGALIQLNWFKVMSDISLGLTNNAINTTKLVTFLGTEVRPFPFLPLRAGTRLATETPGFYSFGFGIETTHFEISTSVQLRNRSAGPTTELAGVSIGAVKIFIP